MVFNCDLYRLCFETHTYMCVCVCVCACMCACVCVCVCVCERVQECKSACVTHSIYKQIHPSTYTHTCTHTQTHTNRDILIKVVTITGYSERKIVCTLLGQCASMTAQHTVLLYTTIRDIVGNNQDPIFSMYN